MKKQEIWQKLREHHAQVAGQHLKDLFANDDSRARDLSLELGDDLFVDFSKNRLTRDTLELLCELAETVELRERTGRLLDGKIVNLTEQRPALHTALRRPIDSPLQVAGTDISKLVKRESDRVERFVSRLRDGSLPGSGGKNIDTLVNIGIGGSDLGPRLCVEALAEYNTGGIRVGFVANLDPIDLQNVLSGLDQRSTMFVVTSKSFTTLETHANAVAARDWLQAGGCYGVENHFIAVSSNVKAAEGFGIAAENIFPMWDWVGGRYSLWSSVGLSVAAAIGMPSFRDMLAGAHIMDEHFRTAPYAGNIPVVLGLLDVWYNNFFGSGSQAIVPYDQRLKLLPEYLSQLVMESNGKGVDENGIPLKEQSSHVVWGSIGTNAQHAYFQLLHQGTRLVPVEFLLPLRPGQGGNYYKFVANCIAQAKALMLGRESVSEPWRNFPGNRPSTTILYKDLTPAVLGMLLAMYEHRTYVQAMVWGINPFDQWGVELGKTLAVEIIGELEDGTTGTGHDASTLQLLERYRRSRA